MLGYLAIFGAAMGGYAGGPPWIIAAAAIALMAISYSEHHQFYKRGQELGMTALLENTILRSAANAIIAAGSAFAFGWLFRLI